MDVTQAILSVSQTSEQSSWCVKGVQARVQAGNSQQPMSAFNGSM
jgi:hypothetical protein